MVAAREYNNHRSWRLDQVLTDMLIGVVGGVLVIISVRYLTPSDIFTTSAWVDSLGFNEVIQNDDQLNVLLSIFGVEGLSFGASIVGIGLWLSIIFFIYSFQTAGKWSKECENLGQLMSAKYTSLITQKPLKLTDFNHEKMMYFVLAISLSFVDILTDAAWKSNMAVYGNTHFLYAAAYSFVVYNLASEWFIIVVGKEVIQRIVHLLYGLVALISPDIAYAVKRMAHSSIDVNAPTDGYRPSARQRSNNSGGFLSSVFGGKKKDKDKGSERNERGGRPQNNDRQGGDGPGSRQGTIRPNRPAVAPPEFARLTDS